jgi:hypothetical protein
MVFNRLFAILVLFVLLPTSFVLAADGCITFENCTYYAYAGSVTITEVNLSIKDSAGDYLVTNQAMTSSDNETFKYVYTHNTTGNVIAIANFYNSSGFVASSAESKEIRSQEVTENNMTVFGVIIAILGSAALLLFMSTQTSTQSMTHIRRVPEKVLLYISSLMLIPVMWFFSYIEVANNPALSYLTTPLNLFFAIIILIVFALISFYLYNMLKVFIDSLTQKKDDYDGEE